MNSEIPTKEDNNNEEIECSIVQAFFEEIYPFKKIKYGKNNVPYDFYINETLTAFSGGEISLRIVTNMWDYTDFSEQKFIMDSYSKNEAIIVLIEKIPNFDEYEKAKKYLYGALESAKCYVCGKILEITNVSAENKINTIIKALIESVYTKINLISEFVEKETDISDILNGSGSEIIIEGTGAGNEDALNEIITWLERRNNKKLTTSIADFHSYYSAIPYGWRKIDIAALAAKLIVRDKISLYHDNEIIAENDDILKDFLCNYISCQEVSFPMN